MSLDLLVLTPELIGELDLVNKIIQGHKTIPELKSICECMQCDICSRYSLSENSFESAFENVTGYKWEIVKTGYQLDDINLRL